MMIPAEQNLCVTHFCHGMHSLAWVQQPCKVLSKRASRPVEMQAGRQAGMREVIQHNNKSGDTSRKFEAQHKARWPICGRTSMRLQKGVPEEW